MRVALISILLLLNIYAKDLNFLFFSGLKGQAIFNRGVDFNRLSLSDEKLEKLLRVHFNYMDKVKEIDIDEGKLILKFINRDGFDKDGYLKRRYEMDKNLIHLRAVSIEKFLDVLDREQILILREMIYYDKNFDDRG